VFVVVLAAFLATGAGRTAPPLAPPAVVFGADAFYEPLDFLDENGEPTGFDVELFRAVALYAGLRPQVHMGDWDRILADFEAGRIDVVPIPVTEARRRKYLFSTPFLYRNLLAFGRPGATYIERVEDLAGKRVAAHPSDTAAEALRQVPGVILVPVRIEGNALLEVKQGRADYALVPGFIGYQAQKRFHLDDVVAVSAPMVNYEYAFAVLPSNRALLARINTGLEKAGSRGDLDRLYRKWLANLSPEAEVYRSGVVRGAWLAVPVLLLAAVLLVWWRRARRRSIREAGSRAVAEARVEHLAYHDVQTGLLNANGLERAVGPLIRVGAPFALIRVELADLESVEAVTGREYIESVLREAGQRLAADPRVGPLAHVERRAFVAAAPAVDTSEAAGATMAALMQSITRPSEVGAVPLQLECYAGAALFPAHAERFQTLLAATNLACAASRDRAGASRVYDLSLAPDPRNLTLLADLRSAIQAGTLGFALQPKLALPARAVTGAEVLVRWNHPVHGPLAPAVFVPMAEKTDVIGDMSLYMAAQAVDRCIAWKHQGVPISLSVNISVNDLSDARVVEGIARLCAGHCGQLILEVTETAVMRDPESALAAIGYLRARGIRISLDDFGTGSGSLTYLRQMAPDEVKIDQSFISGLLASEADRAIVRSTIDLAQSMGAVVTAEGVEDAATLEWLAAAGCDYAQGFFIARPMATAAFVERFVEPLRAE
jgi:EAL domain-containing protein (putative c-di-GMP-specific phosphodiesterase class I)/ABC-type amino acid transport substrate-binding protein/GGDEF domain-containing protein